MKPSCFPLLRCLLISGFAGGLLLLAATPGFATPDDNANAGLTAAKDWTAMIDAGHYEDSYNASSDLLRLKMPENKWSILLKTFRDAWGPVVNRKETNHVLHPNGFEGTEGEFLVVTYDTSFKSAGELMEVVVMRWDGTKWQGAGYNGGPLPPAPGSEQAGGLAPAQTQTETTNTPLTK